MSEKETTREVKNISRKMLNKVRTNVKQNKFLFDEKNTAGQDLKESSLTKKLTHNGLWNDWKTIYKIIRQIQKITKSDVKMPQVKKHH